MSKSILIHTTLLIFALNGVATAQPLARLVHSSHCQELYDGNYSGESNLTPPDTSDSRFISDQIASGGDYDVLDQAHGLWWSEKVVDFCIETTRYVGPVDGQGFLQNPDKLINDGLLNETLTLTLAGAISIPDFSGQLQDGFMDVEGVLHRRGSKFFTLDKLEGAYTGWTPDDPEFPPDWGLFELEIQVDWLKFPDDPGEDGQIQPRANEVSLVFSGQYIDDITLSSPVVDSAYVHIDWISIEPADGNDLAWRPILLLHGWNSSSAASWLTTDRKWVDELDGYDILYETPDLVGAGRIPDNGKIVTERVKAMKKRFGVNRLHIAGHSKGGLDGRDHAQAHNDDVETLMMLGSPHEGTVWATILTIAGTKLVGGYFLGGMWVTPPFMDAYNSGWQPNGEIIYAASAGDHTSALGLKLQTLFGGPNDRVVSVESALGDNFDFDQAKWTYTSSGDFTIHSPGVRDNPTTFDDFFNEYIAVLPPIEKAAMKTRASKGPVLVAGADSERPVPRIWRTAEVQNQTAVASQAQLLKAGGDITQLGMATTDSLTIGDVREAIFLLYFEEDNRSALDLALIEPGGGRIDSGTSSLSVTYLSDDSDEWPQLMGFHVDQPAMGQWKVEVSGQSSVPYAWGVFVLPNIGSSIVTLAVETDADFYLNNDPITITATLDDDGTPVTGATVEAEIVLPDSTIAQLILFDDETNGDPTANDGQYTNVFAATTQAGIYAIAVTAEQTAPLNFTRNAGVTASVAQSRTVFAGSTVASKWATALASDAGVDTDSDGLFNQLVINLDINADVAGTYRVYGTLTDGSSTPIDNAHVEATVTPGLHTVSLVFDGETIRNHGVDGPYQLQNVMLKEADTGAVLDFLALAHTTAGYSHTDFQRPSILLTGVTNDYGWDLFGDPSFDFLVIEVEVDLLLAGDYQWGATMFSQDGTFVAGAFSRDAFSVGTTNITFLFEAFDIVSAGQNGPYVLKLLAMGGDNLSTSRAMPKTASAGLMASLLFTGVIATTQPYTLPDFGGTLPLELTLDVLLAGPYNSAGTLTTDLNTKGYLETDALNQPYAGAPWNYAGSESLSAGFFAGHANVVDWVYLQLRSGDPNSPQTLEAESAGLLLNDGSVVSHTDGSSAVSFNVGAGAYYVAVFARNHLAVLSSQQVDLSSGAGSYDFTDALNKAFGTEPMQDMGGGHFGLWPGDANSDGIVIYQGSNNDPTAIDAALQVGGGSVAGRKVGYLNTDLNLDGNVDRLGRDREVYWILQTLGLSGLGTPRQSQVPAVN